MAQKVVIGNVRGPKGDSAYQVAVDNGFIGSEAEWLDSLKGELVRYATVALMDADISKSIGQLAYVFANNSTPTDPANKVYQWTGSAWVEATWYFDAVAGVVQPLVDEAEASASLATEVSKALLDIVQAMGFSGALAASSNGSAGTYGVANPIAQSGRGIRYRYRANLAGTLRFLLLSKSGDTFTVDDERVITVTGAGEYTAEFLGMEYTAGQLIGVRVSATGVLSVVAGADPDGGWYYTNAQVAQGGTFIDAAPTTSTRLNHSIELLEQVVTGPRFTALENETDSLSVQIPELKAATELLLGATQIIGFTGDLPVTAPNGSGGTYAFVKAIESTGRGIRYRYRANVAGTIYLQTTVKSGDTFTVQQERAIPVAAAGEGYAEFLDMEYEAGQLIGVRCSPAGVLAAEAGVDPDGGWYYTNAQVSQGNSFVDAAASTTVRVAHRIELLEQVVTGDRFTALENEVAALSNIKTPPSFHMTLVLGESHAAGVPTQLSPVVIPEGSGYRYRRDTTSLSHLQDPTGNAGASIVGAGRGSMFVSFGDQMLQQTASAAGAVIVNSAEGGTSLTNHWHPTGASWLRAVTDWDDALAAVKNDELIVAGCSIVIVLGSNDAAIGTTKASFKSGMLDLITRARTLVGAGASVPVVLMQTGPYLDGSYAAAVAEIQAAQAEIVRDETNVFIGYSARYAVARGQMIDNVHMNQAFNDDCGAALAVPALHGAGLRPVGLE